MKGKNDNSERASSVDSEDEKFNQWQMQREKKMKLRNYIKNDKIYSEEDNSTSVNTLHREKKRLNKFISEYKNDRIKHKSGSTSIIRSHLSEVNRSLTDMANSEKDSADTRSHDSHKNTLSKEVDEKNETNFFDIFLAISKPIVNDRKGKKKSKKFKKAKKLRAHSNAFSEPNI